MHFFFSPAGATPALIIQTAFLVGLKNIEHDSARNFKSSVFTSVIKGSFKPAVCSLRRGLELMLKKRGHHCSHL